jgi:protein-disulfide isomerase
VGPDGVHPSVPSRPSLPTPLQTIMPDIPRPRSEDDTLVSFTVRRSHLFGIGGLLVGFAAGVLAAGRIGAADAAATVPTALVAAAPVAESAESRLVRVETEGRPGRGPEDAPVVIVEFTDYGCPFCRRHADSTLVPLLAEYGDRVRYVVRNFPILSLHPQAGIAAEAAECAHDQDRFWELHGALFAAEAHDPETLKALARRVGLDAGRFDRCLDGKEMAAVVERDLRDGVAAGVTGTPTFFVNGRPIEGWVPTSTFASLIDDILR